MSRDVVVSNRSFTADSMRAELAAGTRNLDTFRDDIDRVKKQLASVKAIPRQL